MITFSMDIKDYKEYFKGNTKMNEDDEFVYLTIRRIKDKNNKEWEYSIKWSNDNNDEKGIIRSINTSSAFAVKSCDWNLED